VDSILLTEGDPRSICSNFTGKFLISLFRIYIYIRLLNDSGAESLLWVITFLSKIMDTLLNV